ncbi:hypothetical protein SAMN05216215_11136 [Saccharopolyspora shandongensis]|uniref:Uncharacterized protein n=2 Tax=Saccharopolyspora shandongensis TaxID=418495 RepID=A0A1H3U6U1_9PSEU|nr:hypothetical protein SAMN05216215_11136 [Saccharopolyspora shandongensis]
MLTDGTAEVVLADAATWVAKQGEWVEVIDLAWRTGGHEKHGHTTVFQLRLCYRPEIGTA